ncbi:hypothetical protein [Coprobacter tertius]|uniref:Uncharacterized protein n=1 Tax=Coprobacter tertius TaxID=2944915 RepID=A0ABT1MKX2_9BACT|nr:hypothetical protein [Coprobacter tertius]MCP9612699.1 hypothetical protein [Coprobacter tertius]
MADNPKLLLGALSAKIKELIRRNNVLKEKMRALEDRIAQLEEEKAALHKDKEEINIKYLNLKTAKGIALGAPDVKEARNRFNKIVREIDKCISLLNE